MANRSRQSPGHFPLGEVALVINFPPEASVECLRHRFHDRIRDRYSLLIPPETHPGVPPAFEPYRFDQEDGSSSVILALHSLGYVTYEYTGYRTFQQECLRLAGIARETFGLSRLTRVGLRYTNIIPFSRTDGRVPIEKYLRIGLKLPRGVEANFDRLHIRFAVPASPGEIDVIIEPRARRDDPKEEAIFLVLSYEQTGNLGMEAFAEYLDTAHGEARGLFKSLITDSYRRSLKEGAET